MAGRVLYLCLRLLPQQSMGPKRRSFASLDSFYDQSFERYRGGGLRNDVAFYHGPNPITSIPPAFEEMTDRAELVFAGKALDARSEWRSVGTNRVIFILVDFETNQVVKWDVDRDMLGITKIL